MNFKGSLGNVFFFHTYLVVAETQIKFIKVLCTTQFIQEIINENNSKFVFDGDFVEGMKFKTHAPRSFFLKYHDHRRRIESLTRMDNVGDDKFLNNFLNFIFLGKGMMIGMNIGRNVVRDKENGMIVKTKGRRNSLGSGKNNLMFGEDGLEVWWHEGCLSGMDGMELCNNVGMKSFEDIFHVMGNDDFKGAHSDSLELILLALLVELHGYFLKIYEDGTKSS